MQVLLWPKLTKWGLNLNKHILYIKFEEILNVVTYLVKCWLMNKENEIIYLAYYLFDEGSTNWAGHKGHLDSS